MEYVQAMQRDVDLALELGRHVFARNVDDVSPRGRKLLAEILTLVTRKHGSLQAQDPKRELFLFEVTFTRKELRETTGWSETQVRQNIEPLVGLGYLGKLAGRQGSACRYVLLDDGKDDPCFNIDLVSTLQKANGSLTKTQPLKLKSSQLRTGFALSSHKG